MLVAATLASGATAAPPATDWNAPATVEEARRLDYCNLELTPADRRAIHAEKTQLIEHADRPTSSKEVTVALLLIAGLELASVEYSSCREALQSGEKRFRTLQADTERMLRRQNRFRRSRDPQIAEAQKQIAAQWRTDQVARQVYVTLKTETRKGPAFWASRLATANVREADDASRALMTRLLAEWDWFDRKRFGPRISDFAWLLVQHADDDPGLQALALARMTPYLARQEIKPANYAYLLDRIAVNEGRPQRYGTQPIWKCNADRKLELHPVEDPENLDRRRAELMLKPARLDLDHMSTGFCGTPGKEDG